jgi:hypothetical protein
MTYTVVLSPEASADLLGIYRYALYCRCGRSRAHCVKRISSVAMSTIRSVSGHVSLIRYLPPTPLCSVRVTGLRRSYRRLRLPIVTASSLAV